MVCWVITPSLFHTPIPLPSLVTTVVGFCGKLLNLKLQSSKCFFVHFLATIAGQEHETSLFHAPALWSTWTEENKSFFFFSSLRYSSFGFNARIFSTIFDKLYNPYSPPPPPQTEGTFALDPPSARNFFSRECLSYPLPPVISRIWDRNPWKKNC